MMIPFNQPCVLGSEQPFLAQAMASSQLAGNGQFTRLCEQWLESRLGTPRALLTPSCTAALEMAAILLDLQAGDEVIMPSYTFVSTANAFALRGAKIVFVDIRPETMNLDERLIEHAITPRTRAIVVMHYGGVACEMHTIMALAKRHNLVVVEDAAQALLADYQGKALGTIGHLGCFSFHETKNLTAGGEGGALLVNLPDLIERAEIVREKGTNRSQFFRGEVDKYIWRDLGSSYLMSELQAAYLYAQFCHAEQINQRRMQLWQAYANAFQPLAEAGCVELPSQCGNAHLFYLKVRSQAERAALIAWLKARGILAVFHYVPLHHSPAGQRFGRFCGEDRFTSAESERLVRLPLFYNLTDTDQAEVIHAVRAFWQ